MLLSVFLIALVFWIGTYAPAPARMEYAHLEEEISKIYGQSAKVPPASYVLVTDTVTIARAESLSKGELIMYGDIQLKWDDETIAWDPRNFKNITYTLLHSKTIWYPRPHFRNTHHTIDGHLIEADFKGRCHYRVHFTVTLNRASFQRVTLQLQVGEDESSVMLSPAQITVMEPLFESSFFKISFVDQWHDKRLSNVLVLVLDISEDCKIDAKRVFMMCSRFIGQISTFFTKPQNIHRITILLLSTLLAMTESSFVNCVRSSEQIFPLAFLVTVIAETYAMLLFYRLWEWIVIRRSRNPRNLHFYESIPLRPEPLLGNIRESSIYEPDQHDPHQAGSRRPLSVMLPPDLPSIPLPRISDARARQDAILQGQLDGMCKKLVIADRICVAVISVSFVVLEAVFC